MLTLILHADLLRSANQTERLYRVIEGLDETFLLTSDLAALKKKGQPFQIIKSEKYYRKHLHQAL
ncbi:MAG: hypothetical protein V4664_02100 [Patescibacteria group bacterium]